MSDYIEREAAEELISQPITMSLCLTREECLAKRSQRDIDVAILHSIPAADVRPVEWIPVAKRLPDERQFVLAWKDEKPKGFACISFWMDNAGWAFKNITHWMPLPEPPKEE